LAPRANAAATGACGSTKWGSSGPIFRGGLRHEIVNGAVSDLKGHHEVIMCPPAVRLSVAKFISILGALLGSALGARVCPAAAFSKGGFRELVNLTPKRAGGDVWFRFASAVSTLAIRILPFVNHFPSTPKVPAAASLWFTNGFLCRRQRSFFLIRLNDAVGNHVCSCSEGVGSSVLIPTAPSSSPEWLGAPSLVALTG
jgi:hypothetical protein